MMMVVEEVLVMGVFIAALLTVVACFGYLVYATILEEYLLRSRSRTANTRAGADGRGRAYGRPALPAGRH
jgi:hypothetical protein